MRVIVLFSALWWSAAAGALDCARPGTQAVDLDGVPAIVSVPSHIAQEPIVLWHGFGPPAGEQALMDALPLDDVPAIKVYAGLPLFGKRTPAGGTEELIQRQQKDVASLVFEPAVMGAAKELPTITRALSDAGCMKPADKVSLFGFSAGGAAVLYALIRHEVPIASAVTVNASTGLNASIGALERATHKPYNWTPHARDLAAQTDAPAHAADIASGSPPPALLIIHGADDQMLTPQVAYALHSKLLPLYSNAAGDRRLQLEVLPHLSHAWTQSDSLDLLRAKISEWYRRNG